ncbi:hypothetical protein C8F01DRAFT_724521 [Mycena amicta]|nr:hypothetical protein C8F01DRAFT_724521 [Mycena amicta]
MAAESPQAFARGQAMMYKNFTLILHTFTFGAYSVLMLLSGRLSWKRGLRAQSTKILFAVSLFMYILSAAFWVYDVAYGVGEMQNYVDPTNVHWATFFRRVTVPFNLFNAVVLVNFVFTDAIVIWRAWVICSEHRKFLFIPAIFFLLTTVSTAGLIVLRVIDVSADSKWIAAHKPLTKAINVLQLTFITTSLLSNMTATGLIGITAWRHRRAIRSTFTNKSKVNQILWRLLESGMLYCVAGILGIVTQLIRLPYGTLNDMLLPLDIQIAGAYAPAVLLLISSQASTLGETEFLGTVPNFGTTAPTEPERVRLSGSRFRPVLSALRFNERVVSEDDGIDSMSFPGPGEGLSSGETLGRLQEKRPTEVL